MHVVTAVATRKPEENGINLTYLQWAIFRKQPVGQCSNLIINLVHQDERFLDPLMYRNHFFELGIGRALHNYSAYSSRTVPALTTIGDGEECSQGSKSNPLGDFSKKLRGDLSTLRSTSEIHSA